MVLGDCSIQQMSAIAGAESQRPGPGRILGGTGGLEKPLQEAAPTHGCALAEHCTQEVQVSATSERMHGLSSNYSAHPEMPEGGKTTERTSYTIC